MVEVKEAQVVNNSDQRFSKLMKGFNLRWPETPDDEVDKIYVCTNREQIRDALTRALADTKGADTDNRTGKRITVRSGGNCYEGFVSNNPKGSIIDIGLYAGLNRDELAVKWRTTSIEEGSSIQGQVILPGEDEKNSESGKYTYHARAGTQNWDAAVELFKRTGKAVPGGSCYPVALGGHICGGGYGLLSRKYGLTVDHVAGVNVMIVQNGKPYLVHANKDINPDLFQFCRGAGGGGIGIITDYFFNDTLPTPPKEVAILMLDIPWEENFPNTDDGKDKFKAFMKRYGKYMEDDSKSTNDNNWGLFTLLKIFHRSTGAIRLNIQYFDDKSSTGKGDYGKLQNFLDLLFDTNGKDKIIFGPSTDHTGGGIVPGVIYEGDTDTGNKAPKYSYILDWLDATQTYNGAAPNQRSKYKSSYMKSNFDDSSLNAFWNHFGHRKATLDFSQSYVQIDSYGGKINQNDPGDKKETAIFQRKSIMKLQYMAFWYDPHKDKDYQTWLSDLFRDVHIGHYSSLPYPYKDEDNKEPDPVYEGCYINYPDVDMIDVASEKNWETLYFGTLRDKLRDTKKKYDPDNIFRHQMSIPLPTTSTSPHTEHPHRPHGHR